MSSEGLGAIREMAELRERLAAAEARAEKAERERDEARGSGTRWSAAIPPARGKGAGMEISFEDLQRDFAEMVERLAAAEAEADRLRLQAETLQGSRDSLWERVQQDRTVNEMLDKALAAAEARAEQAERERNEALARRNFQENEAAEARAEARRLRDAISPGDAAAYEEGMAVLQARLAEAEALLREVELLTSADIDDGLDMSAEVPSGWGRRLAAFLKDTGARAAPDTEATND